MIQRTLEPTLRKAAGHCSEAKSGQTIAADFFAGLEHWRLLAGDPAAPAALIHGGGETLRRRGFAVYSWAVL